MPDTIIIIAAVVGMQERYRVSRQLPIQRFGNVNMAEIEQTAENDVIEALPLSA